MFACRTAAALVVATALWSAAAAAGSLQINARAVPLVAEDSSIDRVGRLDYLGGLALSSPHPAFGGLSSLELEDDGRRLVAISDRGWWLRARIVRDGGGRLESLVEAEMTPIVDPGGAPVTIEGHWADAESLVRLPNGTWLVGFERRHRLLRFLPGADRPEPVPAPSAIDGAPFNGGLEAMAALDNRRLLMVAEDFPDGRGNLRGWLRTENGDEPLGYAATTLFKPTDFAWLPDGDLLALERRYTPLGGAAGRLQRIARDSIKPGALLRGEELALIEKPMLVDNYEGLAAVRDADGSTLIYLLSDDNFNVLQRTLLLLFRLRN